MKHVNPVILAGAGILSALATAIASANGLFKTYAWLVPWLYGGSIFLLILAGIIALVNSKRERREGREQRDMPPPPASPPPPSVPTNSVASFGQQGGVTAGTVNITTGLPEPKLELTPVASNVLDGELYKSEFKLVIIAQAAIPNLYLKVEAPTITKRMEVIPQRTGVSMVGHSGSREDYNFTNLQNAYGIYIIRVWSAQPEQYKVIYAFEDQG